MAVLEAIAEQEMTDEQFAEEIKDLVRRLNLAATAAAKAGIAVEFLGKTYREAYERAQLEVKVARPL